MTEDTTFGFDDEALATRPTVYQSGLFEGQAVIDTNLNGTWYMMHAMARRWQGTGTRGNIVNIVATFQRGMPGVAHTCAARAAVTHLSKTVAVEWAQHGIRVNCIAPGAIAST